ncbi:MAG TPA: SAF domain-containing protein [Solirubrobacteraceae bacterium]
MSRRRRGALLAGLALLLGGLAASDVAGREAALRREVGPLVDVVVAREPLAAGTRLSAARLGVRRVPARFAPRGGFTGAAALDGLRVRAAVPAGADVTTAALAPATSPGSAAALRRGERSADVLALASAQGPVPGGRVDVLVTREARGGAPGRTTLAIADVEVLAARPASEGRMLASLRVTLRQAVYLAAAQAFAREIRLLPRPPGERSRLAPGLSVTDEL